MNFFYSRLFFLAMLLIQGAQPQVLDGDLICNKFGTLATANSGAIQDYLNDNLGGTTPIDPPAGNYTAYTVTFDEPSFDGCEVTVGADVVVTGTAGSTASGTGRPRFREASTRPH
jgi:hypothetical protein